MKNGRYLPMDVTLEVGELYVIDIEKPTNKKDRQNNHRVVKILGFTSDWMSAVVVRYIDTGRRGLQSVDAFVPIKIFRQFNPDVEL